MDARRIHRISRLALAILSAGFVLLGILGILGGAGLAAWLQLAVGILGLVITGRDLPTRPGRPVR